MTARTKLLAKAVYDNIAETPDEIAFRRGDVLAVLEQDTGGLEGWWLCSLRGKQGIAPGNRLKILSEMKETFHKEPSPQPAILDPRNRNSLDASPNKVITPQKVGGVYMYENGVKPVQDYDVPPTRFLQDKTPNNSLVEQPNYDTPPTARNDFSLNMSSVSQSNDAGLMNLSNSLYDTPPKNKPQNYGVQENMYDVPPSSMTSPGDVYDIPQPSSNRSSVLSNLSHLSNESTMTYSSGSFSGKGHHSNPPSMCDSARSSMDISPQDLYDIPPSASEPRPLNHNKQPSADSGLDFYDSPPKSKYSPEVPGQQDYDVPRSDYDMPKPVSSVDSSTLTPERKFNGKVVLPDQNSSNTSASKQPVQNTSNVYDLPDGGRTSLEHDIDDVYDIPQSNAPVRSKVSLPREGNSSHREVSVLSDVSEKSKMDPSGVYDIPPQVTRDSMLSSKSDSSDGNDEKRLSTCSVDSRNSDIPIYDELPLDLDAAMDLMIKLQQDVQKSTTKLSSFVSSTWRTKAKLESNLYGIKLACSSVRSSLEEFLDFAQGTLANSARLPDRKLINKLHKQLAPLQQTLLQIKICMKNLDEINWQAPKLVTDDVSKNDDLGKIAAASKELTQEVRRLVSSIHGNSSLLFRRASDIVISPVSEYRPLPDQSVTGSKPPLKSKPQLPPKPQVGGRSSGGVQHRPLPPPPPTERPLPPTPGDKKLSSFEEVKRISGDFTRNSDDCKRYSAEFRQMSLDFKAQQKLGDSIVENKDKDIVEEYDYVHLEARDADDHIKNKEHNDVDETPVKDTDPSVKTADNITKEMEGLKTPVNVRAGHVFNDAYTLAATIMLDPSDKQVLFFYSGQLETHSTLLNNAIDAFFTCIECGQGPKVFISHSKFVVVSAHKLVYIGDSLHKNLINNEVKNKIMQCANHLCNCLKATVTATKTAALQYPSVPAVQDMVDRVVDVSHAAFELKLVITQASGL